MRNRRKIIYEFLPEALSQKLTTDLDKLRSLPNCEYVEIANPDAILTHLATLVNVREPLAMQIVAHGNAVGFCSDENNFVNYTEIIELLRQINRSCNNQLVVNLMTVCSSHHFTRHNIGADRICKAMIGSTQEAFVNSSIGHAAGIYKHDLSNLSYELDSVNMRVNDFYDSNDTSTVTYLITM
jgi:hypothetical protein